MRRRSASSSSLLCLNSEILHSFLYSQYANTMPNAAGATINKLPIRSARRFSAIKRR